MKKIENSITLKGTELWTDTNGILNFNLRNENPNRKLDTKKVKQYIEAVTQLCNGKAMPFLIDLRGYKGTFSAKAAKLFSHSTTLNNLRISQAFIVDSIGTKLLLVSYNRIYNPIKSPTVFKDIKIAEEYCLKSKNKFYGSN